MLILLGEYISRRCTLNGMRSVAGGKLLGGEIGDVKRNSCRCLGRIHNGSDGSGSEYVIFLHWNLRREGRFWSVESLCFAERGHVPVEKKLGVEEFVREE